jgi:hypothetical protein
LAPLWVGLRPYFGNGNGNGNCHLSCSALKQYHLAHSDVSISEPYCVPALMSKQGRRHAAACAVSHCNTRHLNSRQAAAALAPAPALPKHTPPAVAAYAADCCCCRCSYCCVQTCKQHAAVLSHDLQLHQPELLSKLLLVANALLLLAAHTTQLQLQTDTAVH